MKNIFHLMIHFSLALLLGATAAPGVETSMARPLAGHGAETKTLVVYADSLRAYSLSDELEVLCCHLRRVDMKLRTLPLAKVRPHELAESDYVVVFCPRPEPKIPRDTLEAVFASGKSVLWVGYGAEECAPLSLFKGNFSVSPFAQELKTSFISYRGHEWKASPQPWIPVLLPPATNTEIVIQALDPQETPAVKHPLCWKSGKSTFFTSVPAGSGLLDKLFADMILDFFEVREISPSKVYIRIEDYNCRSNHRNFRRFVDYVASLGHPFMVAVTPTFQNPKTGKPIELRTQREFVDALRYAQGRGGRLIMHGYARVYKNESGEGREFLDIEQDQPIPEDGEEYVRARIQAGVAEMIEQGLFPIAWETPYYAGSRHTYEAVAKAFSTSVERFQLSDATYQLGFEGTAITLDRCGRVIVPENLGYVSLEGESSLNRIRLSGEHLKSLRGTIAGCVFHSYLSFERFVEILDVLESLHTPFFDLADLGHWVQTSDLILLSGEAQRRVVLKNASIRWRAFDRAGNLLAEEREPSPRSGECVFTRKGRGEFEIYEFKESTP